MSKKSKSKRFTQEGKDYVQPKNERITETKTLAEAENPRQKGDC